LAFASLAGTVAFGADDGGPSDDGSVGALSADLTYGRLSGDYGTGESSDLDIFTTRVRWTLRRGEVRISMPYLRLTGTGNVTLTPGGPVGNGNGAGNGNGNAGASSASTAPSGATETEGIGDLRLRGEWYLLAGSAQRPWVSLVADVKAPTASESDSLGTGEVDVKGGVGIVQPMIRRTSLLADVSYTRMGDPEEFDYENVLTVGAGMSRKFGQRGGRYLFAYLEHRSHPVLGQDARLDLQLGASARVGPEARSKIAGSFLLGLSDTAEDFGLVLSYGRSF
jgi:hypothetical protein